VIDEREPAPGDDAALEARWGAGRGVLTLVADHHEHGRLIAVRRGHDERADEPGRVVAVLRLRGDEVRHDARLDVVRIDADGDRRPHRDLRALRARVERDDERRLRRILAALRDRREHGHGQAGTDKPSSEARR
jgi:hypothetical protein